MNTLENYLLEAEGKSKEELSFDNPYRVIGFDKDKKRLGWVRVTPFSNIKDSLLKAAALLDGKENFIFVGMGGSINGIKALLSLFKGHSFYTLDSLDPAALKPILEKIKNIDKTLIVSISKSGTTQETQFLSRTLKELFPVSVGKENWQDHFLWLADSVAFDKLDSLGWKETGRLPIQFDANSDIGGRFSSPHTLIFFLPLFILLKKDLKKIEDIYNLYVSFREKIHKQAYSLAKVYKDKKCAYFLPKVKGKLGESFLSWIVQIFQESLGSKKDNLPVKTTCTLTKNKGLFLPLGLDLGISNSVASLMAQMYFFQVFIAFYSGFKKINFVDQDFVEKYKQEMRKLEGEKVDDVATLTIEQIIANTKKEIAKEHKFVEVVLYFYPKAKEIIKVKKAFNSAFPDKKVFIFIGSDWNHHSYQAAFGDKDTFYVFLISNSYDVKLLPFPIDTLKKNVGILKLISKATHLTLKDKSLLFSFSR